MHRIVLGVDLVIVGHGFVRVVTFASIHLKHGYKSIHCICQCQYYYPPPDWFLGHVLLECGSPLERNHCFIHIDWADTLTIHHLSLHFADNSTLASLGTPEYNKLGKVLPIINSLTESFQSVYTPHRDVCACTVSPPRPATPSEGDFHLATIVYLIARGRTAVVKRPRLYPFPHIYTCRKYKALTLTQLLTQPVEKPTACTQRSLYWGFLL